MKRLLFSCAVALVLASGAAKAQTTFSNDTTFYYINNGTIITPQIDAINFINNGLFVADTFPLPFETSSTKNWTNNQTMTAQLGFRFRDNPTGTGIPRPSANFHNADNAVIVVNGTPLFDFPGFGIPTDGDIGSAVFIVDATNIFNRINWSADRKLITRLHSRQKSTIRWRFLR